MKLKTDFKELLASDLVSNLAENHVECWKERYAGKSKAQMTFDLDMNHDDSLEIENAEEALKRKLSDNEIKTFVNKFHKAAIKAYFKY